METILPTALDKILQKYYLEVGKQNGTDYEPDSLKIMQAACYEKLWRDLRDFEDSRMC